jgi:hypothetical protein
MLDSTPVIAEMHPVSCCYLPSDVVVYKTAAELAWLLDRPTNILPERMLVLKADPDYAMRFPRVRVDHDPFTPELNEVLFERFDEIATLMPTQSRLSNRIAEQPDTPDVISLTIVDGLSYESVRRWLDNHPDESVELLPCLVDGPTLTEVAFPNIISDAPPAVRLFDRGYQQRLGFTYWTRENNPLTDLLFRTIPDVNKVGDFSTILATLRAEMRVKSKQKTYIQIVRTGLDGYAHHQKRRPPVEAIVDAVLKEVLALADLFRDLVRTARIHLTADHGILWCNEFQPQIVGRAPAGANPRCCKWRDLYQQDEPGRRFAIADWEFYCLDYPKLRRSLRIDEPGVHGGISFQESIVPFLTIRIGDSC